MAAEALRQREERLRLTLDAADVGTWDWDIAAGNVEWSENMAGVHGQAPGSFGGTFDGFLRTIHADDRERVLAAIQEALKGGDGKYEVEYRQLTAEGEARWLGARGRVIYDEAHRPVRMVGVCADITARKQTEDELKKTRDELESRVRQRTFELTQLNQILSEKATLLEIAHDGIIVRSINNSILFWNQGAELLYGWSSEEALGKITHTLLQTRFPEPLEQVEAKILGEGWWEGELVHTRRDGAEIIVASRWVLQNNDEGRPVCVLEINRDITEHKRAELGLQESEARLRALVESTDDVIFELDEHATYLNVWTTNEQLLVWPKSELLGRRIDEVLGPEGARPFLEACRRVLGTGRPESLEYPLDFPEGKRWFLGRISPIERTDVERRLCLFVREITDRKRAEEEVKQSAERFRLLVEEIKDYAIVMLDPEGSIVTWNVGAQRLQGYRRDEIVGKHFSLLYPLEDVRAGKPARLLTIATFEGRVEDEGWRLRKDGSRFWADVVITPLHGEGGNLRGFSKVTRDVTERRKSEDDLRQLSGRVLRLQDEERRRMARELHDSTAQTLAALSLNLALVHQRAGASIDPKAQKSLAESIELAEQASREIRTFSYLLHPPMLDEAGLQYALQWYVEGFAERTRIRVDFEVSPDLKRLPGDVETALFRVVQECLTNIHRHSESPTARIRLWHDSTGVSLEVADAGKGLPGEAFAQGSEGTVALGVGIRGMRERVRQLGGRLEVKPGRPGTIVEVSLPLPEENA